MFISTVAAAQAPLDYQEAIQSVAESPRLVLARGELELAQKRLGVTASPVQSELSGGYTRTFSNLEAGGSRTAETGGDLDPIRLTTVLNVVPYGPHSDRVTRDRWALSQAEAALRDETAKTLLDITEGYQTALRAEEEVYVAGMRLELAKEQLEAIRTGVAAGTATNNEVLTAELGVRQAEQALQSAVRAQQQALATLSVTLGRTVGTLVGEPPPSAFSPKVTDALLARRSDLLNTALAVEDAELTAAATLRDNLPSGTLNAAYTNTNDGSSLQLGAQFSTGGLNAYQPTFSAGLDPDTGLPGLGPGQVSSRFTVGLGVSVPLNAALSDALAAARLNVEGAELRAAQTLALARLEVMNRAAEVVGAEAGLDLARQELERQRETLGIARQRLELGLLPEIEVRSAEVTSVEGLLALHRAEDALRLAHMRYAAALGFDPKEVF